MKEKSMVNTQEMLDLIDAFIDNEASLANYYGSCMVKFPENREKWVCLRREEEFHTEVFKRIRKSAEEFPQKWRLGRYKIQTVRLVCQSVKEKTEELKLGKLNPNFAVNFIADVEKALIESNIGKAFETEVIEFQQLLGRVQEDTIGHRKLLISLVK